MIDIDKEKERLPQSTVQKISKGVENRPVSVRKGIRKNSVSLSAYGTPLVWLTGGLLSVAIVMVVGLLVFILVRGISTFWPGPISRFETWEGSVYMGEITRTETFTPSKEQIGTLNPEAGDRAEQFLSRGKGQSFRRLVRTGNFELTGEHFHWVPEYEVKSYSEPEWAILLERTAWGRFYGILAGFKIDGNFVTEDPAQAFQLFEQHHRSIEKNRKKIMNLEKKEIGGLNQKVEQERLKVRSLSLKMEEIKRQQGDQSESYRKVDTAWEQAKTHYREVETQANEAYGKLREQIQALNQENSRYQFVIDTATGVRAEIPLAEVVRGYPANKLNIFQKVGIYVDRWIEYLTDYPREANSEGGVFPAIFGTVVMTLLMSLIVVPIGVIAALYLREYARAGILISLVRIAINNLAGVPSIVFGVFGLGFFCYFLGVSIDQLFFAAKLPNPTFGKGGVLWSSLTLALLTLPVVIVATEEALAAVPGSMREGAYACGASKWQTIQRIVLPRAMPGIMTGMILAMARGAGEVAPLMLVGAVKLAPELPIDGQFPFIHLERSFMHLGFHIYDVGFQSQNSEAAIPMVFTTAMLLIMIVFVLNLLAIRLRSRLQKKFISREI
jgi:phosphate transport system permease protein